MVGAFVEKIFERSMMGKFRTAFQRISVDNDLPVVEPSAVVVVNSLKKNWKKNRNYKWILIHLF